MTEITRTNVGDQLILAIGQQLEANRKLCEQTPAWETWTVRQEFRENTSEGYVRWEPSVWLELTKTQQNYVSTAIKALAESGVVDTVAFAQHAHLSFRTIDIAEWWTENLNPGTVNCPVVVNIDAYESLSDEHKAAFDSSVPEAIDHYLANYGELLAKWESILAEKNVAKVSISDEVIAEFRATAADPIRDAWIADMTAQGLPAQELYDLVMSTLEKAQMAN